MIDLPAAAARAEAAAWRREVAYRRVHGMPERATLAALLRVAGNAALTAAEVTEPPSTREELEDELSFAAAVGFNEAAPPAEDREAAGGCAG